MLVVREIRENARLADRSVWQTPSLYSAWRGLLELSNFKLSVLYAWPLFPRAAVTVAWYIDDVLADAQAEWRGVAGAVVAAGLEGRDASCLEVLRLAAA